MPRHPPPLPDEELEMRSLMMRLYHSHFEGDDYYPAGFVNGHAPQLVECGWIEAQGRGWRITEAGILAWAQMNRKSLGYEWAMTSPMFEELRQRLNMDVQAARICRIEGCNQPRKRSINGGKYIYCEDHMREKWSADKRK